MKSSLQSPSTSALCRLSAAAWARATLRKPLEELNLDFFFDDRQRFDQSAIQFINARHLTAMHYFGRFRSEADMDLRARPAKSVANDPCRHRRCQIAAVQN